MDGDIQVVRVLVVGDKTGEAQALSVAKTVPAPGDRLEQQVPRTASRTTTATISGTARNLVTRAATGRRETSTREVSFPVEEPTPVSQIRETSTVYQCIIIYLGQALTSSCFARLCPSHLTLLKPLAP